MVRADVHAIRLRRVEGELGGQPTRVLCEMVGAVDATNLGEQVGHLSHSELRVVDDGLLLVLDID